MVLKYYYDLLSQPSRALYIFLKKTNIPFEACVVKLMEGEHLTDKFKVNHSKFQKVPFIHHDGFRLTESVAILRYLKTQFSFDDHWYPKDVLKQARVDEYLEWQHLNIRLNCSTYFLSNFALPLRTGKQPSEEKKKKHEKFMIKSLKNFEELFLSNGPFINGNEISYADIQAACEIEQPRMAGYDARKHHPKIKTWLERVRNECNPYYDEAHESLNMLSKNNYDEEMKAKL